MPPIFRERVRFAGVQGQLSGELAYPAEVHPAFSSLVIGPHPYMGGTMQNALIAAVAEAIATTGGMSMRFDYSGAGESAGPEIDVAASMAQFWETGHAPEDPARLQDAASAAAFLSSVGVTPLMIVGYSFGAAAAWELAGQYPGRFESIALISPTIARHRFSIPPIQSIPPRLLVLHGRDDFCTTHQQVAEWTRCLSYPVEYQCLESGNHFFRGNEGRVGQVVARFLAHATEGAAC